MRKPFLLLLSAALLSLAACQPEKTASLPAPQEPGPEAVGVICHMAIAEHQGPKGQAFLTGEAAPLWFSSAHEALDWLFDDGAAKPVAAVYVNDMGKSRQWEHPDAGAWVEVHAAVFVLGSDKASGMGGGEVVPFADKPAAEAFARSHGGRVLTFAQLDRAALEQSAGQGQ